ncbi:DUF58 domain-containing protein [Pseudomonas sp. 21LCFQ010]|uniref:DUF58 domain-containing protein n=1 Tax=Pseudomonas sp. 21LCFQ010 TaxID=2957506 RepID=UPI00209818AC|nr:DUF58 domain-containing protein [Pseudomonas sp. 21LCFQ010]MCO8162163.1 DUF58 domain-containing protein [Pseudomonas sp. 21LCFQ010]
MRPALRLLGALALLASLALVPGILSALAIRVPELAITLYWATLLALLGIALLDAVRVARLPSPRLQRHMPASLALGRWSDVQLEVQHDAAAVMQLRIFDHVPDGLEFEHLPQNLNLPPQQTARLNWRLRPLQRGRFNFERCEVILHSPLRLWESRRYLALPDPVKVYPDFARLYDGPLQGIENWLSQIGVRQLQRRGLGQEFHQLREFREGDSLRQIDWKATARHRTPIAREYQDERDQQIMLMLDCGRRMRSQDDALAHFDHGLNACLLLSHIALRHGDAVGLSTFAGEQQRHLPPGKGQRQLNLLLNALFDLQSTRRPADYNAAVQQLLSRQKRRALVILVTNLRDEDDEQLLCAVRQLGQRHRVLIASLRESVLDRLREEQVERYDQALAYCGAVDFLNARNSLHERLEALGIPVIDVRPEELGAHFINRYLGLKKGGVL